MKKHGYTTELIRLYDLNTTKKFKWGKWDCVIWCGTVINSITYRDEDIFNGWAFRYKTKKGAYAYLKRKGFDSLTALADNYFTQTTVEMSMRGDLVLMDDFFAINYGDKVAAVGEEGLIKIPIEMATKSWRVE